jgi:hypothetical protein
MVPMLQLIANLVCIDQCGYTEQDSHLVLSESQTWKPSSSEHALLPPTSGEIIELVHILLLLD